MTASANLVRVKIASVAAKMVQKNVELLDGCRTVVQLRSGLSEADGSDPDLLVLVAVESELEDVPTGPSREYWAPDVLAQKDEEAARYFRSVHEQLVGACQALVEKWGQPHRKQS